ncbi:DUF4136 domain-containing protein [Paraferrimonas sedimenticola]|uniref:DUF4136 domain-containing protein n=1 Tax=Paraferrimonas sedimenticola TaxID=375674 RepID=A0AA37W186_9GAMM|nr:DUF4136 domain-containing protein [Paraferrimonas sedimenticola]GLP97120.1 hypothetical protein GCM10007895_24260 [Paraferrimonas sedimenticola]
MRNLIIGLMALALAACSTVQTEFDYNPEVDFSQYKTYAWVEVTEEDAEEGADTYHMDGLTDERIRRSVDANMAARGFTKASPEEADLLVNYLTKLEKKVNIDTFHNNYGYHPFYDPYWGYYGGYAGPSRSTTRVREYQKGTLIIDLIDNKEDKLVWRGALADTVRQQESPEQREAGINSAVLEILQNYPPQSGAQ